MSRSLLTSGPAVGLWPGDLGVASAGISMRWSRSSDASRNPSTTPRRVRIANAAWMNTRRWWKPCWTTQTEVDVKKQDVPMKRWKVNDVVYRKRLLGQVCVDSGLLMVTDPCYMVNAFAAAASRRLPRRNARAAGDVYELVCAAADRKSRPGRVRFENGDEGMAHVFPTGGDGTFHVWIMERQDGRCWTPVQVTISLFPEPVGKRG